MKIPKVKKKKVPKNKSPILMSLEAMNLEEQERQRKLMESYSAPPVAHDDQFRVVQYQTEFSRYDRCLFVIIHISIPIYYPF
jgi:hypothetical protein